MKRVVVLLAAFCVIPASAAFGSVKDDVKKGNLLYNKGRYDDAAKSYQEALAKDSSSGIASFNLGLVRYKKDVPAAAVENFNGAIASGNTRLIPAADYNIANAQYRIGLAAEKSDDVKKAKDAYETALKFYKRSMDLDPGDKDAKFNYEFVEKKLNELAEKYQFKKDEKKDKDKKEDQKKDQKKSQDKQDQQKQDRSQDQKQDSGQDKKEDQKQSEQQDKDQSNQEKQNEADKQKQQSQEGGEQDKKQSDQSGGGQDKDKGKEDQDKKEGGGEEKSQEEGSGTEKKESEGKEGEKKDDPPAKPETGQGGGGEEEKPEESQGAQGSDSRGIGQEGEEDSGAYANAGAEEDKQKKAQEDGLQAYQAGGAEERGVEMTEQEAKMLLEGYRGEEATGRAVSMRKKKVELSEPAKDW